MANIYEKLQNMRVELQNMDIKKTGENKYAGYKYFELSDILPPINALMLEHKVSSIITYGAEECELMIINCEKPEERIVFCSPMAEASLKGAHAIQNLGAVETYQRRYLYMTAFEIVEADALDATQGRTEPKKEQKKSSTMETRIAQFKAACRKAEFSPKELLTEAGWDGTSPVTEAQLTSASGLLLTLKEQKNG